MCHPGWALARIAAQRLRDLARLRRVRDRIDREYAQPLDVGALARDAGMPAAHLRRAFRLAYGRAPEDYLTARRVERATVLLRHGGLGVAEVCSAVGCPSPDAFAARFTELVGMPPGLYRRAVEQASGPAGAVRRGSSEPSGAGR